MKITFRGTEYLHRFSSAGQSEFTPAADADLSTWKDMVTINLHPTARNGDQLAEVANHVLGNYRANGRILRTDSVPRTDKRSAEHLAVAVLGNASFLEAAFARFLLHEGTGIVVVYSHRIYDTNAGPAMSSWLAENGPSVEAELMGWTPPSVNAMNGLPQNP